MIIAVTSGLRAQDALRALPDNYQLISENEMVRVVRATYGPHQKLAVHDHPKFPTVYVYLTDSGPVRFTHDEAPAFSIVRPPVKAGTFRISPGRLEQHDVENLSGITSQFLRVELKRLPIGFRAGAFRDVRAFDLTRTGIVTGFTSPLLEIERIVAADPGVLSLPNSAHPSLLIVLSGGVILPESPAPDSALKPGETYWSKAGQRIELRRNGGKPAHIPRIVFRSE